MDAATRRFVRRRAEERCEYCGLPQASFPLTTFHVEHIIARQHGGTDDPSNLALSCHSCNLHKGPNQAGLDPSTVRELIPLFHPRRDVWEEHFRVQDGLVLGLTPTGRTTVQVLDMNSTRQVTARSESDP